MEEEEEINSRQTRPVDTNLQHPRLRQQKNHLLCEMLLAYIIWVVGFIISVHWIFLACLSYRYRGHPFDLGALLQFTFPLLALAVFAGGGAWCRSNSTPCPGGDTMSRECLFHVQTSQYIAIYSIHYVGLAYMVIQWILDGIQIWGWVIWIRQINQQDDPDVNTFSRKNTGYMVMWSPYAISFAYPVIVLFVNFWVTLTWSVFYQDWSTSISGSLASLAWRMGVAGLGALLGALLFLHHAKLSCCKL